MSFVAFLATTEGVNIHLYILALFCSCQTQYQLFPSKHPHIAIAVNTNSKTAQHASSQGLDVLLCFSQTLITSWQQTL
jgi:hypothetical protein